MEQWRGFLACRGPGTLAVTAVLFHMAADSTELTNGHQGFCLCSMESPAEPCRLTFQHTEGQDRPLQPPEPALQPWLLFSSGCGGHKSSVFAGGTSGTGAPSLLAPSAPALLPGLQVRTRLSGGVLTGLRAWPASDRHCPSHGPRRQCWTWCALGTGLRGHPSLPKVTENKVTGMALYQAWKGEI